MIMNSHKYKNEESGQQYYLTLEDSHLKERWVAKTSIVITLSFLR